MTNLMKALKAGVKMTVTTKKLLIAKNAHSKRVSTISKWTEDMTRWAKKCLIRFALHVDARKVGVVDEEVVEGCRG